MAEEHITKLNGATISRRMSIETSNPWSSGNRVSSRYNRASIGSCHDLCKFGRKNPFEIEGMSPLSKRIASKPVDHQNLVDILVSPGRKKISAGKLVHSNSKATTDHDFVNIKCTESGVARNSTGSENLMKTEIIADQKKKNKIAIVRHKSLTNSMPYFGDSTKFVKQSYSEKVGSILKQVSPKAKGANSSNLKKPKVQKAKLEVKNVEDDMVQEKTLYVIEMDTQKKPLESHEKKIHDLESYESPLPALLTLSDENESHACVSPILPPSSASLLTPSPIPNSSSSSKLEDQDDQSNCAVTELEVKSFSEYDQTEEASMEDENDGRRIVYSYKNIIDTTSNEADSVNLVLRNQDIHEKENGQCMLHDLVKETAIETQKGKVKALIDSISSLMQGVSYSWSMENELVSQSVSLIRKLCDDNNNNNNKIIIIISFPLLSLTICRVGVIEAEKLNWNPKIIAALSCVCKWFDDLAKRVLWKEFCRTRAQRMMLDLQSNGSHSIDGNWRALGKLLIYCSGSKKGGLFNNSEISGHFVYRTRFSQTSGKSFLLPPCRTDVLYVSDPCEHLDQGDDGDVGFFRGIFKSFATSKIRKILIKKNAQFHPTEVCPYCRAKLWNMQQAKMIPQSASIRLGAYEDSIEYYVCLNGHMLGSCSLLPLSDSEEAPEIQFFSEFAITIVNKTSLISPGNLWLTIR
ncbi:hypothetical protein ACFE04_004124 [Oxalis oulophora]